MWERKSESANKAPMLKINQGRREGKPDAENRRAPQKKNRNQQAHSMQVQMQVQLGGPWGSPFAAED